MLAHPAPAGASAWLKTAPAGGSRACASRKTQQAGARSASAWLPMLQKPSMQGPRRKLSTARECQPVFFPRALLSAAKGARSGRWPGRRLLRAAPPGPWQHCMHASEKASPHYCSLLPKRTPRRPRTAPPGGWHAQQPAVHHAQDTQTACSSGAARNKCSNDAHRRGTHGNGTGSARRPAGVQQQRQHATAASRRHCCRCRPHS